MKRIITLVGISILIAWAVAGAWAEPLTLRYKFTAGEVDKYKYSMNMNMSMPGIAQGMGPISMNMSAVVLQRTLDVLSDGSAKVQISYQDMKMDMAGLPGGDKSNPPKMPDMTMTMTMTPEGKISISSIQGLDKLAAASPLPGMDFGKMLNVMSCNSLFPSGPVDVGGTWSQTMPFGSGQMEVTSTLASASEPIWSETAARINQNVKGHMSLADLIKAFAGLMPTQGEASQKMSQLTGGMDMNGSMSVLFSPALGKFLKGGGKLGAVLTICIPSAAASQGAPSQITMNMDMNFNITRFK